MKAVFGLALLILGSSSTYIRPGQNLFYGDEPVPQQFLEQQPFESYDLPENAVPEEFLEEPNRVHEEELRIPAATPKGNDTYLCTSYEVDRNEFIVGFKPLIDKHNTHHVLLFGCEAPGADAGLTVWNCGDMANGGDEDQFARAPPCATQSNIIYAWAKGAPNLDLPEGVAFPVGPNTKNLHLVVQVHYMHGVQKADSSGVAVRYTHTPQPRTAATLLMVTGGEIPPGKTESFEAACLMNEPLVLHPFAFRVHTHSNGKDVSGWVVQEDPITRKDSWSLIGQRDPQKEQLFETVHNKTLVIQQGDVVASRCIIGNKGKTPIMMGPTGGHEMCNFYMMYWVDGFRTLSDNTCYSPGAPDYHWANEAGLNNLPN